MRALILILLVTSTVVAQPVINRILPSATVELRMPEDVSLGSDGNLYIADTGHNRILLVDSTGSLLAETGSSGFGAGEFQWPRSIAAEGGLSVWVADYGNRRIVKLSRLLEFSGAFEVKLSDTPERVSQIAVSRLGDLFLYAEDSGELLRFDPLFTLQARLGSLTGSEFVPRVRQIVHTGDFGLVWHSRGENDLYTSDAMLTSVARFPAAYTANNETVLCGAGSCLLAINNTGIYMLCEDRSSVVELLSAEALISAGVEYVSAAAFAPGRSLYLLDSRAGSVYRVSADNF